MTLPALILTTIWTFLPAACANMFAIISRHFPFFDWLGVPLDMGKSYKGKRILGDGKTLRGFVFGIFFALLLALLQSELYKNSSWLQENITFDYSELNPLIWGPLLGFGALLGDSVKSFFKRRVGIDRGNSWIPFDQSDFVIGSILVSSLYFQLDVKIYLTFLIVFPVGHIVIKYLGYLIGVDDKPI